MESLPALAVDRILTYLDVADLLSCSLVSVSWRAVVNSDYVWKKIAYNESNKATIDYVRSVQSRISYKFEDLWSPQEQLVPLCYWRVVYMKLQHLKRNWQKANHETHNVTDLAYSHFDLKVENDVLVANVNDNQCEIWNIRGIPRKQETITFALQESRSKCIILVFDDKLVIVQDTLLQVYYRMEKLYKLRYRRLFNKPEAISENIPESLQVDEWYNDFVKPRPINIEAFHIGNYFIGVAHYEFFENTSFHLWDTLTGSKLKEELINFIYSDDPVYKVMFCPPKKDLGKILMCVQHSRRNVYSGHDSYYTDVHVYELPTQTFKKLMTLSSHVTWIYFEDHIILIGHRRVKLSIYDSSNGRRLFSKLYEEIINPDTIQVHKNYLGFTTGGDLVVLSLKDYDLVFTTALVKFSSNLFGFDFVFLDWSLVLINRWDEVNKIEVWSIKEKCLLSTLGANGLMFPCNNSAKFFVWNEMITTIYMLQFW